MIGSLISGMFTASSHAAQAAALDEAGEEVMVMYDDVKSSLDPYAEGGQTSYNAVNDLLGLGDQPGNDRLGIGRINSEENPYNFNELTADYEQSEAFKRATRSGIDTIDSSAASKGNLLSGENVKAGISYAQDRARADIYNYANFNRESGALEQAERNRQLAHLQGQQGIGYNAAAQSGQFGMDAIGQKTDLLRGSAEQRQKGTQAFGQALGDGINSTIKIFNPLPF